MHSRAAMHHPTLSGDHSECYALSHHPVAVVVSSVPAGEGSVITPLLAIATAAANPFSMSMQGSLDVC